RRGARVDELAYPPRDVSRLGAAPVLARVAVARLVGDEELDRMPEHRVGKLTRRRERLEPVAEVGAEELVHGREHLGTRAVVPAQREQVRRLRAPLAEDLHIRVTEAVDRLELVPDEEHFAVAGAALQEVDQL